MACSTLLGDSMKQLSMFSLIAYFHLSFASVLLAGNLEDAFQAANSGSFKKAHELWLIEAENGNAIAQYNLGSMYTKGEGVPKNFGVAFKWYRLAAEQGLTNAQYSLAGMYARGLGVSQSYEDAYAWWLVAATNGHENSRKNVEIAQNGLMTPDQIERGEQIVQEILARLDAAIGARE